MAHQAVAGAQTGESPTTSVPAASSIQEWELLRPGRVQVQVEEVWSDTCWRGRKSSDVTEGWQCFWDAQLLSARCCCCIAGSWPELAGPASPHR